MPFHDMATTLWQQRPWAILLSLFVSYLVGTIIYRLYFHPLAKYPGPFWARISTFPAWWHTRKQNRHLWLLSLQEKYGPEYRHRPNGVCINTPTAHRHIYGPRGNVQKSEVYSIWPRTVDALNTWSATSNEVHGRKRRVLNYAFSENALRGAETFIHDNVDRWLLLLSDRKKTRDGWTVSTNMAEEITYLVMDILGDLSFGKCFDMKEAGSDLRYVVDLMVGFIAMVNPHSYAPWTSAWVWLKPRGLDKVLAMMTPPDVRSWDAFVAGCQESRARKEYELDVKSNSEARKDFFHWLYRAKDPETGKGYSLAELNAECELLTIAGSDTTATVMSALLFYLARNQPVQERLAEEISESFTGYEDIKAGIKLQSCRYLNAVLQESLRMAPPVAADISREVLDGGTTIDGKYYPKGILVATAIWAMQYNAAYYPEPSKFRPGRWMLGEAGSTENSVALAESAFCAFSTGPRGCVGKNMAWMEMRIVLAKLIWTFEIRRDPDDNLGGGSPEREWGRQNVDQYQTYDIYVADRKGPLVQLRNRLH